MATKLNKQCETSLSALPYGLPTEGGDGLEMLQTLSALYEAEISYKAPRTAAHFGKPNTFEANRHC